MGIQSKEAMGEGSKFYFVPQLLLLCLSMTLVNGVVHWLGRNSVPRQLLAQLAADDGQANCLFGGNSLMAAGIDGEAVVEAAAELRPRNIALGSSYPREHLTILRRSRSVKPVVYCYGFFDLQLSDEQLVQAEDLVGNRTIGLIADNAATIEYYAAGRVSEYLKLWMYSHIPMCLERTAVWAKVERWRRRLAEIGMPAKTQNQFGNVEDFALLESDAGEFAANCLDFANRDKGIFSKSIRTILTEVENRQGQCVLVLMPMPTQHRSRYYQSDEWHRYLERLQTEANNQGVFVIDASDWIGDDGFSDNLHMNSAGARVFSTRIGKVCVEKMGLSTK